MARCAGHGSGRGTLPGLADKVADPSRPRARQLPGDDPSLDRGVGRVQGVRRGDRPPLNLSIRMGGSKMTQPSGSPSHWSRDQRLRELMDRLGLEALLLRRSVNFAWYTGGADNRVDHASPFGVADILVTRGAEYVFTNNIEAPRMREEQTPEIEVIEHPWYGDEPGAIRGAIGDVPLGTDFPMQDARYVADEVAPLRYVLDPDALERYRGVGTDASAAVAEAASSLEPGMVEHEAAANLAAACRRRGLFSPVLLVAADG